MKTAFLGLICCAAFAQDAPKLRLPGDVRPLRYDLDLRLVPAEDAYSGRIGADTQVVRPAAVVWLNSRSLSITKATIDGKSARIVPGGDEFVGLAAEQPVRAGNHRIDVEFTGRFNVNDVEGLFRQTDAGNGYVFTQFEPTSARRAFPCFDEPAYKVPWRVTLHVPQNQKAFANTPVVSEQPAGDGLKTVRFAESKPLPSYLVAVAVGPFDISEAGAAGRKKVPVRTITLKGRAAEAAFVDRVTPKIIAALEDYFGMPYPYEKADQITIPITVAFGAMENAGLITYRQTLLLAKPEEDTVPRQRAAASVITHELAHQWFGNMVTPAWWNDIWLNEAFATWMASKIVDQLFPEYNSKALAVERKEEVMAQDGLLSARRIRQPIEEHGDIGNAFDGITYVKGSAVIRMFEQYVGPDRFRNGVQAYMKKHAWGNATATDFLNSISGAAGQNITPAFSQYLDRGGLPLIGVELNCEGKPSVQVTQQRSLPVGSKGARNEYWPTPVCFRYEAGGRVSRECVLLTDPKDTVPLRNASSCPEWITASDNASGYYHVMYRGEAGKKLMANSGKLALNEKVELLKNAEALLRGGELPVRDALSLAREFRNGAERELAKASMYLVASVRRSVPASMQANYAGLIRDFFGEKARRIGWMRKPDESTDERLLRPDLLLFVAAQGEDAPLASEAKRLAQSWLKDRRSVQADIAEAVLKVAAYHGDRAFFDQLVAEVKRTRNIREREKMINAIGVFRDPAIARAGLNLMLAGGIDIRELTGLLEDYLANSATEKLPWEFVTANYDTLLPKLPARLGTHAGTVLPPAGGGFCDVAGYAQVESFFRERIKPIAGGARVLAKVLEGIQVCEAMVKVQSPELASVLIESQSSAPARR